MRAIRSGRLPRVAVTLALLGIAGCDSLATDPGVDGEGGNVSQILIVNESVDVVSAVYFAPCGEPLTENRGSVGSGQSRSWSVEAGCYDFKASSSTGTWGPSRHTVPVASTFTWTLTD